MRTSPQAAPALRESLAGADPGLLYRQIAASIRSDIGTAQLPPGARLPSIMAMAESFGVAPATVRQALVLLAEEGIVRTRHGSGSYVTEAPPRRPTLVLQLGWPALAEQVRGNKAQILEADDAAPPLEAADGLPAQSYRRMKRVHRLAAGPPYALAEIYVARRYFDQRPAQFETGMVLPLLAELGGAELTTMRQVFRLGAADALTARQLAVPLGGPVGWLKRALRGRDGIVAYWSLGYFHPEFVSFEATFSTEANDPPA